MDEPFAFGACVDCAKGKHGIHHPKHHDMCMCCGAIVGRDNLLANPYKASV